MRKILIIAAAGALAAPALAQGTGGVILGPPQFEDGYKNRGQCESALAHERNLQRKDPTKRGAAYQALSPSDFQRESLRTTRCELVGDEYQVVFYVSGIPG